MEPIAQALGSVFQPVGSALGTIGRDIGGFFGAGGAQPLQSAAQPLSGFENLMKVVSRIMGAAGVASNIIQGIRNYNLQSSAINQANQLAALANNPTALAARIRALQQPLSTGLVQDVTNQVQGQLAERGLALSPSIMSSVLGQTLAPYQFDEQRLAMQAAFDPYNLASNALRTAGSLSPGMTNTAPFWSQWAPQRTAGTPGQNFPSQPTDINTPPLLPTGVTPGTYTYPPGVNVSGYSPYIPAQNPDYSVGQMPDIFSSYQPTMPGGG
jgi:hypothetical protein